MSFCTGKLNTTSSPAPPPPPPKKMHAPAPAAHWQSPMIPVKLSDKLDMKYRDLEFVGKRNTNEGVPPFPHAIFVDLHGERLYNVARVHCSPFVRDPDTYKMTTLQELSKKMGFQHMPGFVMTERAWVELQGTSYYKQEEIYRKMREEDEMTWAVGFGLSCPTLLLALYYSLRRFFFK